MAISKKKRHNKSSGSESGSGEKSLKEIENKIISENANINV